MSSLYKLSIIISLIAIFITTIINNRKCRVKGDPLLSISIKLYFSIIPILNIIVSIGMLYICIDDIIHHKRLLKKDI